MKTSGNRWKILYIYITAPIFYKSSVSLLYFNVPGPNEFADTSAYIKNAFLGVISKTMKSIRTATYVHFSIATDTTIVDRVFNSSADTILQVQFLLRLIMLSSSKFNLNGYAETYSKIWV